MRALLIVNPHATSTTDRRRDLLAHALASELRLSVEHTSQRGHATELAARAAELGCDLVVAHGGDGTVNEVVNGLMTVGSRAADRPQLAVVPGGSTNVFARAMGVDQDPTGATEQILGALVRIRGRRPPGRVFSLGKADDRYFTFNAGLGLDAEVVAAVERVRDTGRTITNSLHVRKAFSRYFATGRRPPRLTVTLPGAPPRSGVHLVFVSNVDPWTYWQRRAIHTNPATTPDGGLGVFALTSMRLPTMVRISLQLLRPSGRPPRSGALLAEDDTSAVDVTCEQPIGFQVDGDYLGTRDAVQFRSVPDALELIGPDLPAE
jgi:diacylglycerol kinase family enzyme